MTDMLDLITLFAGIGIGWLMGRTLARPQRAQNAAGRPYTAPQGDLGAAGDAVVGSDDSDPAERHVASDCPLARARGTSARCDQPVAGRRHRPNPPLHAMRHRMTEEGA